MPLFVDVRVNDDRIGRLKINRLEKRKANKDVYKYRYIITSDDSASEGTVSHRYDDGAWKLIELCVKDAGI